MDSPFCPTADKTTVGQLWGNCLPHAGGRRELNYKHMKMWFSAVPQCYYVGQEVEFLLAWISWDFIFESNEFKVGQDSSSSPPKKQKQKTCMDFPFVSLVFHI